MAVIMKQSACELERLLTDNSLDSKEKLENFKKTLDLLAANAENFSSWLHSAVDPMIEQLTSLNSDESDLKQDLRECTAELRNARTFANYFIDRLKDFFKLAASDTNGIQAIKDSVKKGESKIFKNYISQLRMTIENCQKRYEEFKVKHKDAKEVCGKISKSLEAKKVTAYNKKIGYRAAGAGAVATGGAVAVSVVAGLFTFGIGTVVGLSATAVGAGVSLAAMGQSYAKMEEMFKSFCGKMDKLNDSVTEMGPSMVKIHRMLLTRAEDKMDDVDRTVSEEESAVYCIDIIYFSNALDLFVDMAKSVLCQRKIKCD